MPPCGTAQRRDVTADERLLSGRMATANTEPLIDDQDRMRSRRPRRGAGDRQRRVRASSNSRARSSRRDVSRIRGYIAERQRIRGRPETFRPVGAINRVFAPLIVNGGHPRSPRRPPDRLAMLPRATADGRSSVRPEPWWSSSASSRRSARTPPPRALRVGSLRRASSSSSSLEPPHGDLANPG